MPREPIRPRRTRRVGFVIGRQLHELRLLHPDRPTGGAQGVMRFGWVAARVNSRPGGGLRYEMYRPWRRYDLVVFMKAMDGRCQRLREKLRRRGIPAVFDANVNYYERGGTYYFEGMEPTEEQRLQAERMTSGCDAVIADSVYLEEVCRRYSGRVGLVTDNVETDLAPARRRWERGSRPLDLLWSGQAHKLFELLAVERVLLDHRRHVRLVLVTNSLDLVDRCFEPYRSRLRELLGKVPCTVIPFEGVERLMEVYGRGGVGISPRFLDNPYNMGHTEWKITLPMACGRMVLCSPLPSYREVHEKSRGEGVRLCGTEDHWREALDRLLGGEEDVDGQEEAALRTVREHYATEVVAGIHAAFVGGLLDEGP